MVQFFKFLLAVGVLCIIVLFFFSVYSSLFDQGDADISLTFFTAILMVLGIVWLIQAYPSIFSFIVVFPRNVSVTEEYIKVRSWGNLLSLLSVTTIFLCSSLSFLVFSGSRKGSLLLGALLFSPLLFLGWRRFLLRPWGDKSMVFFLSSDELWIDDARLVPGTATVKETTKILCSCLEVSGKWEIYERGEKRNIRYTTLDVNSVRCGSVSLKEIHYRLKRSNLLTATSA